MNFIIGFEIFLLAIIIGMILWFRSKSYADFVTWQQHKREIGELLQQREEIEKEASSLQIKNDELLDSINTCSAELCSIKNNIKDRREQFNEMQESYQIAETAIRDKMKQDRDIWYNDYCEKQKQEYLIASQDFAKDFREEALKKLQTADELAAQISQLRSTIDSAVEIAKHKEEEKNKQYFYQLHLEQTALDDIQELEEIMPKLNQPEVLGKMIWKTYYEKPYTDLLGRLGLIGYTRTGIYKITNTENEMCYVGQAINISERWKQHIKRAIGAETPTQNKLYPAMKKYGLHNFTFEIIQECPKDKLNAREDYWQDFYKAKEFGYSIK